MKQHIVTPVDVGTYLGAALKDRELTLQVVSQTTQLSQPYLEQLISGKQILTGDAALLLAETLDVPVLDLLAVQSNFYLSLYEADSQTVKA